MKCPECGGDLTVKDSRSSDYIGRVHKCSTIAYEVGGSNCQGRIRKCLSCNTEYVTVETIELKVIKPKKENVWD